MNPEIEKLIDYAIVDGVISEKERALLLRKAEKLGEYPDEVEMILDAKLVMKSNTSSGAPSPGSPAPPPASPPPRAEMPPPKPQESSKAGNIQTCPACGATVNAMELNCSECRHEFRNISAVNSIKEFHKRYMAIEADERKRVENVVEKWHYDAEKTKNAILQRQISLVGTFPIPNTKEDIMEFLTLAFPEATKDLNQGWLAKKMGAAHKDYMYVQLQNAWKSKCTQVIMKARQIIKDNHMLNQVESYAKKMNL